MTHDINTGKTIQSADLHLSEEICTAVQYIHDNYAIPLTRERVATACYLSPNYFSTQFRKEMGICFRDYLIQYRIEKSAQLLTTGMSINEIALKVGYNNRNRFIINFRQRTGVTPSEYRKKALTRLPL